MLRNSNTIALQPQNSQYEEFPLSPTETGLALPGTILAIGRASNDGFVGNAYDVNSAGTQQTYNPNGNNAKIRHEVQGMRKGLLVTQAGTANAPPLGEVRPFIVIENALLGTGLNKPSIPGSTIPGYMLANNDVFNVRCVSGAYYTGQPVYMTQTPNGIYVTNVAGVGTALPLLGHVEENYVATPEAFDLVDTFNYETGAQPQSVTVPGVSPAPAVTTTYRNLNGVLVNLLRVRIMHAPVVKVTAAPPVGGGG